MIAGETFVAFKRKGKAQYLYRPNNYVLDEIFDQLNNHEEGAPISASFAKKSVSVTAIPVLFHAKWPICKRQFSRDKKNSPPCFTTFNV